MIHAAVPVTAGPPGNARLLAAVRSSLRRALSIAAIPVAAGGAAAALAAALLLGMPLASAAPVAAGALAGAVLMALLVAPLFSGRIAVVAAMPTELLLDLADVPEGEPFNFAGGRALSRRAWDADLTLLRRRARQAARQRLTMVGELAEARSDAQEQNRAKSEFLANMSHELRTPLNAILGYAMLLSEEAAERHDEPLRADLERIQTAGRRLLMLVNDVLDLSRLEAEQTVLFRAPLDVGILLAEVARRCDAAAGPNGNRFELAVADDLGLMVGDAEKIGQCVENLLRNAFKFTHDGEVRLAARRTQRDGAAMIEITVSDTGSGIEPAKAALLFEAFRQVDASAQRRHDGSGLGLAIVSRLARLMGGDCTVESAPGHGSRFHLELPLGDSARTEFTRPATGAPRQQHDGKRRALIVDDDEATLDLLERWLHRLDYDVIAAPNADNLLELAHTHRPDVILLDALLPGRSGYDYVQELRADGDFDRIPVILVTVDDDRARGMRVGATDYLRKPLSETVIRQALEVYHGSANARVLVIDDDDNAANLVERCVAQIGLSSRRAQDGEQGLAMAREESPDAIVLDLSMPVMNGFDLMDQLAADAALRHVPVMVVSGKDISLAEHKRLTDAGHRFFTKAASTPREIAQSLREMIA